MCVMTLGQIIGDRYRRDIRRPPENESPLMRVWFEILTLWVPTTYIITRLISKYNVYTVAARRVSVIIAVVVGGC